MHIPRQYAPAQQVLSPDVQRHRERLADELRRTVYWSRLVQARLDLLVAGLLYAAPSPTQAAVADMHRADPLRHLHPLRHLDSTCGQLSDGPSLSMSAPMGMDLSYLLDGGPLGSDGEAEGRGAPGVPTDTGDRLDRLRATSRLLAQHERSLLVELGIVTPAPVGATVRPHVVAGSA